MEHLREYYDRYRLLVFAALALLLSSAAIWAKQSLPTAQATMPSPEPSAAAEIVVDVEGAVAAPGVRRLPEGSLVEDAIAAAGGLTGAADAERVARDLNRADKLKPNQKIFVPARGSAAEGESAGAAPSDGKVNLNTATAAELEKLPGVGEATAEKIIAYREERGGFSSVEELQEVPGIGDAKFAELQDKVSV